MGIPHSFGTHREIGICIFKREERPDADESSEGYGLKADRGYWLLARGGFEGLSL
jgi:hypothetical protein